ncbi:MAG: hypothetical protein AAB414_00495, partial [Patescibacteria group bacterium]
MADNPKVKISPKHTNKTCLLKNTVEIVKLQKKNSSSEIKVIAKIKGLLKKIEVRLMANITTHLNEGDLLSCKVERIARGSQADN